MDLITHYENEYGYAYANKYALCINPNRSASVWMRVNMPAYACTELNVQVKVLIHLCMKIYL